MKKVKKPSIIDETIKEDDQLYQVDSIVDKHVGPNGIEKFKVRWLGYSMDDDTWANEEDALPLCCDLIKHYEKVRFNVKRKKNRIPEVIRFRKVHEEFKLLVRWPNTNTLEFFYSSVIQSIDPNLLVELYEKHTAPIPVSNKEWTHFLNTKASSSQIYENDVPQKIISVVCCGEKKVCLVHWEQKQEATIVEYDLIKDNHPELLIQFYERHLIPK